MARVPYCRSTLIRILTTCVLLTNARAQLALDKQEAQTVREVEITVVPGRLMFSPRTVMAQPGERLRFKVRNTGELVHNFVICCEGGGRWKDVAEVVIDRGELALAQGFDLGPPLVTHAMGLLRPGEEAVLLWRAPPSKAPIRSSAQFQDMRH